MLFACCLCSFRAKEGNSRLLWARQALPHQHASHGWLVSGRRDGAMGFTRPHVKSVRLINGTLGGSVSARVANRGLARPARSLVHRGPGERRVREGAG